MILSTMGGQLAVLGSGDPELEDALLAAAERVIRAISA
jgi:glycogen synthase